VADLEIFRGASISSHAYIVQRKSHNLLANTCDSRQIEKDEVFISTKVQACIICADFIALINISGMHTMKNGFHGNQ